MDEGNVKPEKLTCNGCISKKWCRRKNITKGSVICEENRGLRERKPKKKEPSANAQALGLLGHLMRKTEGK